MRLATKVTDISSILVIFFNNLFDQILNEFSVSYTNLASHLQNKVNIKIPKTIYNITDIKCIILFDIQRLYKYIRLCKESMEQIFTIIIKDLEVAEKSIEEGDFSFVTIIGNRIMTNLLVAEKNELMILGWMVRDLGLDITSIKAKNEMIKGKSKGQRGDDIAIAKELSKDYLRQIKEDIANETINARIIFDKYYIMQSKMRKIILLNRERTTYDAQTEFSKSFAIKMIDIFYANKNIILTKQNNLLPSIVGELSRTYNEYGGKEALYVYFIFKTFNDLYKYAYLEMFLNDERNVLWDTKSKLNEYTDLIYNFKLNLINDGSDPLCNAFNDIVSKIGLDFRLYYLVYSDIVARFQVDVDSQRK